MRSAKRTSPAEDKAAEPKMTSSLACKRTHGVPGQRGDATWVLVDPQAEDQNRPQQKRVLAAVEESRWHRGGSGSRGRQTIRRPVDSEQPCRPRGRRSLTSQGHSYSIF